MTDKKDEGGMAFPETQTVMDYSLPAERHFPNTYSSGGMSLRDYFAAHALPGLMVRNWSDHNGIVPADIMDRWASSAYILADAMIKERSK